LGLICTDKVSAISYRRGLEVGRVVTPKFFRRITAECAYVDERGGSAFGWRRRPRCLMVIDPWTAL
jgi:hypothetical protein